MTTSSDICSVSNFSKVQRQQSQILDGNCPPAVWVNGRKKLDCFHHFSRDFRHFLTREQSGQKKKGTKKWVLQKNSFCSTRLRTDCGSMERNMHMTDLKLHDFSFIFSLSRSQYPERCTAQIRSSCPRSPREPFRLFQDTV